MGFLIDLVESDPAVSTLIAVDFSLGYPAGTAAALGLTGAEWSAMWDLIADRVTDDDRNVNNRFAVAAELNERLTGAAAPFWGCPPSARGRCLVRTKPSLATGLAEFRAVERLLRARGARPFSSWQLLGAGCGWQSEPGRHRPAARPAAAPRRAAPPLAVHDRADHPIARRGRGGTGRGLAVDVPDLGSRRRRSVTQRRCDRPHGLLAEAERRASSTTGSRRHRPRTSLVPRSPRRVGYSG